MRPRLPTRSAVVLVLLRSTAVLLSVVSLAFLLYCTVRYRETFAIGYASSCWSILYNAIETAALTDRTRAVPRLPPAYITCIELLTVVLSVVAAVLIAVNDPGKIAMDPWRIDAAYLQGVVGSLHCIFSVFGCLDCYAHVGRHQ